jgi:hypothetical protein
LECKNLRSDEKYADGSYKLETQKTRNQKQIKEGQEEQELQTKGTRWYKVNESARPFSRDAPMSRREPEPFYTTPLGRAYLGDSLEVLPAFPDGSVNLIVTSPPYALHFKKEYGNVEQGWYVNWFLPFARQFHRLLSDDGSLVLDIGGAWQPGRPTRSLYHFELLIALYREVGFHLAQEFYWYNPAKLSRFRLGLWVWRWAGQAQGPS